MAKLSQQKYDELVQKYGESAVRDMAKKRGDTLPSGGVVKNLATGFVKGAIGDVARPTAQMLQGLGQRAIAAATPMNLEQVRKTTGLKSLDDSTTEGRSVVQALKTQGAAETTGRVAANIASFFIPTAPAVQVAGRTLTNAGKITTRAGIGLSTKEAPLIQAYKAKYGVGQRILAALQGKTLVGKPITNADTAIKNSLFGTESMIGVQAKRAASNIWNKVISPALKTSQTKVSMSNFVDDLSREIEQIPELTRRGELRTALNAFADDYKNAGEVSLETLQKFKEGWAKFVPDKVYRGKAISSSFRELQNMAAGQARAIIYKSLPNIEAKAAYFDYGNMKNLQELGQKAMTGSKLKGGAGSFISGLYDKVVTPIATTGGLTLYRVGEGLEFVGNSGAKILGHLFK